MDTKTVGTFTFSHIGDGLYKSDAPCVCDSLSQFESLEGGGDLLVILQRSNTDITVDIICDRDDNAACDALHKYRQDHYLSVGINAYLGVTHVYPDTLIGGLDF